MSISTKMEKFQEILGKMQALDIRTYEQLNEDNPKEAKAEFLADETMVYPQFMHAVVKLERLAEQADTLVSQVKPMIADSGCSETQKLILGAVWEQIFATYQHTLRVLLNRSSFDLENPTTTTVSTELLSETSGEEKVVTVDVTAEKERLEALSREYYGYDVDSDLVWALLHESLERMTDNMDNWSSDKLDNTVDNWTKGDRRYLDEIRQILAKHGLDDVWERDVQLAALIYRPDDVVVEKLGRLAQHELAPVLEKIPEGAEVYSADVVVDTLNQFFQSLACGSTAFHAVKDTKGTVMAAYQAEREMRIPEHRSKGPIDWATFYAKIGGHEVGTHIMRGIPYEQTELTMLSTGFLEYGGQEEGIAVCTEKALMRMIGKSETVDHSPIDYLVGIGLASLYGFNFRELWTLERDIFYLKTVKRDSDREAVMQRAVDDAYGKVRRVFRGTGYVVDFKDACYYLEEVKMWQFITEHIEQPEKLWATLQRLGKANICDSKTLEILRAVAKTDDFPLTKQQLLKREVLPFVFAED